ncbi:polyprenyl synthetase family protein [Mammaliicoccus sciuri]|uniref:Farnesyl diphosphate synthase n=2 Tax=Sporosarcina newyorkensis TaxID=759851 RepID=A0A1T4XGM1_9BACL|nr:MULTISPECIES: farnesyl diphosphate synthase [Sporosarcina]EGQ27755.1 geranyltranstransferase [Sporosarcina newyorkensis 2681]MBY0220874.1 polyprenyl synthetase family protein [Sporosarcina aquimarina]SKA88629.1 farnesyl-diphosphate synthase [Sporosarcina newyorkensis]
MNEKLKTFMDEKIPEIERELTNQLAKSDIPDILHESMTYSIQAGGKRIRPLLVLAVLSDLHLDSADALKVAASVELIHTYSLIHDDLPCMDDDDFRRGKPTNHKKFGEDVATLAGDAMQALAFQALADLRETPPAAAIELVGLLAKASGAQGMVKGQVLDMKGEQQVLPLADLEEVHLHKTGALLAYCIDAGAVLAEATADQRFQLARFSRNIGLAFQIQDDILDVTATTEQLGKPANSDMTSEKSTYPSLLGIEGAQTQLKARHEEAINALRSIDLEHSILHLLADYIIERNK